MEHRGVRALLHALVALVWYSGPMDRGLSHGFLQRWQPRRPIQRHENVRRLAPAEIIADARFLRDGRITEEPLAGSCAHSTPNFTSRIRRRITKIPFYGHMEDGARPLYISSLRFRFGGFHPAVSVAVTSAAPRRRFARLHEIERDEEEPKHWE